MTFVSSMQAIDVIVRDQRSKAIAERAVLEQGGPGWLAHDPQSYDPEYGPFGYGRTREEAIADLIENSDLDTSPPNTPEQLAAENAAIRAEDDWIPPGGWDDEDDGQPDEAQEWADYDRGC